MTRCRQRLCQVLEDHGCAAPHAAHWHDRLAGLTELTPGDFAVAVRQQRLRSVPLTALSLFDALAKECREKPGGSRSIGFTSALKGRRQPGHRWGSRLR